MKVFTLKSCDTCRKALKGLRDSGAEPVVVDVVTDGIEATEIERFLEAFGEALVNRRSTTWRNLSEKQRQQDPVTLLLVHPKLMKRPIIEANGQLFLGWGPEVRNKILGSEAG